jgi:hypothetical protein
VRWRPHLFLLISCEIYALTENDSPDGHSPSPTGGVWSEGLNKSREDVFRALRPGATAQRPHFWPVIAPGGRVRLLTLRNSMAYGVSSERSKECETRLNHADQYGVKKICNGCVSLK